MRDFRKRAESAFGAVTVVTGPFDPSPSVPLPGVCRPILGRPADTPATMTVMAVRWYGAPSWYQTRARRGLQGWERIGNGSSLRPGTPTACRPLTCPNL